MAVTRTVNGTLRGITLSFVGAGLCLLLLTTLVSTALAQPPKTPAGSRPAAQPPTGGRPPSKPPAVAPTAPGKPGAKKDEEEKPPEPESTFLRTKDGWSIYCTYYGPK